VFLGFIKFYKYFVILYSKVTTHLIELLKGSKQKMFKLIKEVKRVLIELK
ncbi:hypothetical protein NEUTE2DRAFT_71232, partial [Neurospora tetrasperma FGSC 2509]